MVACSARNSFEERAPNTGAVNTQGQAGIICLYAIIMLIGQHHHWSRIHRHFMRHEAPQIQKALENENVFVKKVLANAAIEIIEFEDEGSGYIYDVGG